MSDSSPLAALGQGLELDCLLEPGQLAFVHLSESQLHGDQYVLLPASTTVLTLPVGVFDDRELIVACRRAIESGYAVALEGSLPPPSAEIEGLVQYRKIDVRAGASTPRLREAGCQFVATDVETHEAFARAIELQFDLVQGHFFCTPRTRTLQQPTVLNAVHIRFLAELSKPEIDYARVAESIRSDVALTLGLLRYINSAWFGLRERIDSIEHALRLLGGPRLRKWGTVVGVAALSESKPRMLLTTSIVRGRFCERLGEAIASEDTFDLFLVGMMSCLDAILDIPMAEAVHRLPFSDEVTRALNNDPSSDLGRYLVLARGCETGSWDTVSRVCVELGLLPRSVLMMYYDAMAWASALLRG